jgi:glutaredoxin
MPDVGAPYIILYTTPTCPDCHALKRWLSQLGIAFDERDLADPQVVEEAKARTGVRVAPITIVDSNIFFGPFESQRAALAQALHLPAGS